MSYETIILADLHLKDNEGVGGVDPYGTSLRTKDKLDSLSKAITFGVSNKVNSIIIAGDLFDNTQPSNKLKASVAKILSKAIKQLPVYIIGGNHETTDNKYFNLMSESSYSINLIFAKNSSVQTNEGVMLKLISSGQEDCIEKMSILTPTILIGHFQIDGALFDNERISKYFIKPHILSKFLAVFNGHFHKRQHNANWRYIGALCRNTFGECSNSDGFLYLHINSGMIIKEEYITIEDRKFIKIYKDVDRESDIYKYVDSLNDLEDNIIKITFKLKDVFQIHRRKIKEYIKSNKNPFDAFVEYEQDFKESTESISNNITNTDVFSEYVKKKKISKKLIKIGNKILKEMVSNNEVI